MLTINKTFVSLDPFKIIYVECTNKTLSIVMENEKLEITYKLTDLEEMLKGYGFIRIHKGYLVNYRYIFSIERGEVILDIGERLPVSKYRISEVKEEFRRLAL